MEFGADIRRVLKGLILLLLLGPHHEVNACSLEGNLLRKSLLDFNKIWEHHVHVS